MFTGRWTQVDRDDYVDTFHLIRSYRAAYARPTATADLADHKPGTAYYIRRADNGAGVVVVAIDTDGTIRGVMAVPSFGREIKALLASLRRSYPHGFQGDCFATVFPFWRSMGAIETGRAEFVPEWAPAGVDPQDVIFFAIP